MWLFDAVRVRRELADERTELASMKAKLRQVSQEAQAAASEVARAQQGEATAKAEADRYRQQLREQVQTDALRVALKILGAALRGEMLPADLELHQVELQRQLLALAGTLSGGGLPLPGLGILGALGLPPRGM